MEHPAHPSPRTQLDPSRLRQIESNFRRVQARIAAAAERSSRALGKSSLLAVVKKRADSEVDALRSLGLEAFAENRVQAAAQRPAGLLPSHGLHLIGPLQTNKVRRALELFGTIHSLDRPRLLHALCDAAASRSEPLPVYVQVNISGEAQKHGVAPPEAGALCEAACRAPQLRVLGLMAMAAHVQHPEEARPTFAALRELGERLRRDGALDQDATGLSMGMSRDFDVAIEEGATIVRVGTALFVGDDEDRDPESERHGGAEPRTPE